MEPLLAGRTAVITGAASGIGRAIARTFADHGASVVVADVRRDPRRGGRPTEDVIADDGGDAVHVECDVTDRADLANAVEAAEAFGGVDVMVNNAGIAGTMASIADLDYDRHREIHETMLDGVVFGAKAAATRMVEAGTAGSIVNMSSTLGFEGAAGALSYSSAKAGVRQFTYSLADELGPAGIRVNALHPGLTETAITTRDTPLVDPDGEGPSADDVPLCRCADPSEIADVALFLASDLASFVTAESILVDGGSTNTI